MFRQQLEEMVGQKTLMLKLEAPEELIDDPTLEIRRLNVLVSKADIMKGIQYRSTQRYR